MWRLLGVALSSSPSCWREGTVHRGLTVLRGSRVIFQAAGEGAVRRGLTVYYTYSYYGIMAAGGLEVEQRLFAEELCVALK